MQYHLFSVLVVFLGSNTSQLDYVEPEMQQGYKSCPFKKPPPLLTSTFPNNSSMFTKKGLVFYPQTNSKALFILASRVCSTLYLNQHSSPPHHELLIVCLQAKTPPPFFCNIQKGTQQALTKCMLLEEKLSGFPKTTQIKGVGEGGTQKCLLHPVTLP